MTPMWPLQEMSENIVHPFGEWGLHQDYDVRPAYQRNDYLARIARAKRPATRMKRIDQMLSELETGGVYMKMRRASSEH